MNPLSSTLGLLLVLLFSGYAPFQVLSQNEMADKKQGSIITKKNGLVVLLESEAPNYVAQLTKDKATAELKNYRSKIEAYNAALKEAVEAVWDFSEISYVSADDYLTFEKSNRRGLVVLFMSMNGSTTDWSMRAVLNDQNRGPNFLHPGDAIPRMGIKVYAMDGNLAVAPLPTGELTSGSLGIAILDLQSWLENWYQGKMLDPTVDRTKGNAALLKDYTLVVRKYHLSEKLNRDVINQMYPYGIKVVEDEEFNEIVLKRVPKHAVLYPWKITQTIGKGHYSAESAIYYLQSIMALDNSKMLALGLPKVSLSGMGDSYRKVEKKHLKKYASGAKR